MLMKALRFLNLAILSALVGSTALVYAQEEKQQDEKPARQEEAKPQPKQDEAKPSRQNEAKPSNQDTRGEKQDQQRGQEQSGDRAKPQGQERPETQGDRNKPAQERPQMQNDHNQQGQHSEMQGDHGRKGGHIPDDRFHAQFGREHHFNARTVIVQGRPQFQYGGYNFELIDAWPSDWAYTDDCYIDYIDGEYYLIDLVHPGVRLAVFVVM
jgi:hypothetical protein